MSDETKRRIAELEAQVTPCDVFHALMFGMKTADGVRFFKVYGEIRALKGDKVESREDGNLEVTPSEKLAEQKSRKRRTLADLDPEKM